MWHPFNATNQKGTCLWCGRTPPRPAHTKYEFRFGKDTGRWYCPKCKTEYPELARGPETCPKCMADPNSYGMTWLKEHQVRGKIISREYRHKRTGAYGDGFFCGLRCAYQFAVSLAKCGRRLQPKEATNENTQG